MKKTAIIKKIGGEKIFCSLIVVLMRFNMFIISAYSDKANKNKPLCNTSNCFISNKLFDNERYLFIFSNTLRVYFTIFVV